MEWLSQVVWDDEEATGEIEFPLLLDPNDKKMIFDDVKLKDNTAM